MKESSILLYKSPKGNVNIKVISKMETTAAIKIQDTNYISDFDKSIKK